MRCRAGCGRAAQPRAGRSSTPPWGLAAAPATALVYGVGGLLAIDGLLTVGTRTALAGLLTQLYGPLTSPTNLLTDVMNALGEASTESSRCWTYGR